MWSRALVFLLFAQLLGAERYALMLSDAPALGGPRVQIQAAQTRVRGELAKRRVPVTGSAQRILNAVFVEAPADQVDELRALPGVTGVARLRRFHRSMDRAVQLVNATGAWAALGGTGNAGAGVKIAIIDTGIDQNHPAFQDASLSPPDGFPICQGQDCAFTNGKVIVARSYIRQVAAGTPPNPAATSRPDDYSPRDHVGHGTALAMIAAGNTSTGPAATITGMAPKAWVGNYKIFGSPGINDGSTGDAIIQALEDALNDGMDVAVLSLGSPALSGPLDRGSACGQSGSDPCDPEAVAVENAIQAGIVVVAAAGNEGDLGSSLPTLSTIDSPGTAPSVIAAGATTNAHVFVNSVRVSGPGVPGNIQQIFAVFGDGPLPPGPVSAPLVDVTKLGDNGLACTGLPPHSLDNSFALIQRGTCTFPEKVRNAQDAGALGAVVYQQQALESLFPPGGLTDIRVPAVLIGFSEGQALRSFVDSNGGNTVTLDPGLAEADSPGANEIATFSSRGPNISNGALKPDLVAVGTELYMATQQYDPGGEMYNASGYTVQEGTSFSTPMVAGGVALVKQKHPEFRPPELRSAVINSASQDITEDGRRASVTAVGAGKLDAGAAVASTITVQPATLSFGVLTSAASNTSQSLTLTNHGSAAAQAIVTLVQRTPDTLTTLRLDRNTVTIATGQSAAVSLTLSGRLPRPGIYEGALNIQGGGSPLTVPYLYVVGDGVPADAVPLLGFDFSGTVNEDTPDGAILFKLIDQFGVGVPGVPVRFRVTRGGGTVRNADSQTDRYGIAGAEAILGPTAGAQQFTATAGGQTVTFDGNARPKPTIRAGGVVNAASFQAGVAPGSYISIFGTGLSDTTSTAPSASLPVDLSGVSVSFDAPGLSLPGKLYFVSPQQVNAQVPWEFAGQGSVQVKVNIAQSTGSLRTVTLSDYAPGVFEYDAAGGRLAAALDENFQVIGSGNPARRGRNIQIYCNGLGPVDNPPETGEPAGSDTPARTTAAVTVTIGGVGAQVSFSGLAPGFSGLYQVNVAVPQNAPTGVQPVVVTAGGVASNSSRLPVQ